MILGQIAWLDCLAFLLFLAPQLLLQIPLLELLACAAKAIPNLLFFIPYQLIRERYLTSTSQQSPFVQRSTLFQDVVIRCVRYAFAQIPAAIGKVFFSKPVALPFLRFRMLRHGYLRSPIYWKEVDRDGLKGIYMIQDSTRRPDVVVYYCHGGGFSMGSSYFYLEFLLAWLTLLHRSGFSNPCIYALEYSLVPNATYPTQLRETLAGYKYCLSLVRSSSQVCVSGDSAGGTLVLSLLLCLSDFSGKLRDSMPGLAVLISPWATIVSPQNRNTSSDYLDADSLKLYGSQYVGTKASATDALLSPGSCKSIAWWRRASPSLAWFFVYGAEEVFAPETQDLVGLLKTAGEGGKGVEIKDQEEEGWVHAWPVVKLFLCASEEERLSGLAGIVGFMSEKMGVDRR